MNTEWAIAELDKFIAQTVMRTRSGSSVDVVVMTSRNWTAASDAEVTKQAQIVEKIFDRVIPDWRSEIAELEEQPVDAPSRGCDPGARGAASESRKSRRTSARTLPSSRPPSFTTGSGAARSRCGSQVTTERRSRARSRS